MDQLSEVEYLVKKINSHILDIFDKVKKELDKRDWLKPLIDKYGAEGNIPWKERRELLFREVIREIRNNESSVLKEALLNMFAQWIYAKRLLFGFLKISDSDLDVYLGALKRLHERRMYPDSFVIWNPTHGSFKKDVIIKLLNINEKDVEVFVKAMDIGFYLSRVLGNISPLVLLVILLPTIDKKNKFLYLKEGEAALKLFMIKDYWYSFVEKRALPDIEHWEFWRSFIANVREEEF